MIDKYDEVAERIHSVGMPSSYPEGTKMIAKILREAFPPVPSPLIGVDTPSEDVENMIEHRTLYLQNQISALEAQLAEEKAMRISSDTELDKEVVRGGELRSHIARIAMERAQFRDQFAEERAKSMGDGELALGYEPSNDAKQLASALDLNPQTKWPMIIDEWAQDHALAYLAWVGSHPTPDATALREALEEARHCIVFLRDEIAGDRTINGHEWLKSHTVQSVIDKIDARSALLRSSPTVNKEIL